MTYAQQQEPIWPATGDQVVSVLLNRHWSGLHGLAVNMLRDRDAAQDAVQDTFIAIIRRGPVFDGEDAALRYARTAVLNNCRSHLRRLRTARKHLRLVREPTTGLADEPGLTVDPDVSDAAGRPGVGVGQTDRTGVLNELIFDRDGLRLIGTRQVRTAGTAANPTEQVLTSSAFVEQAIVDDAGERPN